MNCLFAMWNANPRHKKHKEDTEEHKEILCEALCLLCATSACTLTFGLSVLRTSPKGTPSVRTLLQFLIILMPILVTYIFLLKIFLERFG
jgi:hypothetical protein